MGDHGIVSGYHRAQGGRIEPVVTAETNAAAAEWGLQLYRSVLYRVCDALQDDLEGDVRPLVHEVMDAFWCRPTREEAEAWGSYPYDSDPAGTAARRLARPFNFDAARSEDNAAPLARGDRAWLAGSLALSGPAIKTVLAAKQMDPSWSGAPATD